MLLILAIIGAGLYWLLFFKLRWLERTRTSQGVVVGIIVFVILAIWFTIQRTSPMTGNLRVTTYVIPLGSRSGGRVTKVHVKGSQVVKTGDKLFEVDPDPYRYDVKALNGALVDARQKVRQLTPTLDSAQSALIQRQNDLAVTRLAANQAEENVIVAQSAIAQRKVDLALSQSTVERMQESFKEGAVSAQDLDSAKAKRDICQDALKQATEQKVVAELSLKQSVEKVTLAEQAIRQAKNQQNIAELNLNSTIDGEHSSIAQVKANLADAEWNVKESIVYAPANGFIPEVQLKEGFIAGLNQPVLSLVSTDDWWVYGLFEQSKLGLVEPGDNVEMVFRFYPGRVFTGKVDYIIRAVGQGQLPVNGMVTPVTPSETDLQLFAVKVVLDDESRKTLPLNLGATGQMVILTQHARSMHIIGRMMLRFNMWGYYLGL